MSSAVSICNKALRYLGGTAISSLEEDSQGAKLCRQFYPEVRDELLEAHNWSFATAYVRLAALSEVPPFTFARVYQLPADCLRVRHLQNGKAFEQVAGRKLYTDSYPAEAVVTSHITDPSDYPAQFVELLSRKLAAELAVPLMNSTKLESNMMQKYLAAFERATDADVGTHAEQQTESDGWIQVREL